MANVNEYPVSASLGLTPTISRRSPAVALLLSMLFPGLGHLYIGLRQHAFWLIGSDLIGVATIAYGTGNLHGQAVLAIPALYSFAMADAYFAAREWNAGATWLLRGANPRVAAVLNLLTKGFGYFYLGDRVKGVICFLTIGSLQVILLLHTSIWTLILAISLQVAIAADGYRVGRQRLLVNHPELGASDSGENLIDRANPGGLKPAAATSFFFAFGAAAVVSYAALRALSARNVPIHGSLEQGPAGLTFRNSAEHFEVTVPETWRFSQPEVGVGDLSGSGCSILFLERTTISAVGSIAEADQKVLLRRHPNASITHPLISLAGRDAEGFEAEFVNQSGVSLHQRFIDRRRGLQIFLLVETWVTPEQRTLLDMADQTIKL